MQPSCQLQVRGGAIDGWTKLRRAALGHSTLGPREYDRNFVPISGVHEFRDLLKVALQRPCDGRPFPTRMQRTPQERQRQQPRYDQRAYERRSGRLSA